MHHEDFTGQHGKFYRSHRNSKWYKEQKIQFQDIASKLGYPSIHEHKKGISRIIKNYVKGSSTQAKILDIDVEKERISLGIKQLTEDVTATEIDNIRKGSTVTCTIAEITENGLEVSVGDNLKGFIKKNDLSRERADQKTDRYGVGDKVDATVTNIDKKTRKISLSIKAREIEEEKKAMAEYGSSDSGASLGDILGAALAKKDEKSS